MSSILENKSFKWIVIGGMSLLTTLVIVMAVGLQSAKHKKAEERKEAERQAVFEYQTRMRSKLVRIYQKLKIDHYLAAYKNLEGIDPPPPQYVEINREYNEVIARIAKGLIENDFLNEAETLLLNLQGAREFEDEARELLISVASRRRWKSAIEYVRSGKKSLEQHRWQDAVSEFKRAKAEYESVKLFKVHDVDKDLQELADLIRQAKYQISYSLAQLEIGEAERSIEGNFFNEALDKLRRAGDQVATATYYGGKSPDVVAMRRKLVELEAELSFRVPNSIPIWNKVREVQLESSPSYFFLDSYKIDQSQRDVVSVKLDYRIRTMIDRPYTLRVKVFLSDGRFFFDGRVLSPESNDKDEKGFLDFQLVYPDALKGLKIKKIDIEVHDPNEQRFSFVQRAFRLASPS